LLFFFLFSELYAYRLKDEDVTVVNGIITRCIYDISTKGNIIEIPDVLQNQTITGIGDYAFSVAGKIAVLTLPSTLTTIGNGVFEGHALTSIEIPNGVTSIGFRAFYGNALYRIDLPVGLKSINDETFANNQLNSLILPDGIEHIGWGAFQNNKISELNIPNSVKAVGGQAFSNNKISILNFQEVCQLHEIPRYCFASNDIKNISIPNSVLTIEDGAFNSNPNLSNVTFGTGLLKIKRWAFSGCNLTQITLPENLVFIGRYAFDGNPRLANFRLPVSAKNYQWNDSNGDKQNAGNIVPNKFYSYVARIPYILKNEDVVIQNGVLTSCSYFNNNTNLGSLITIPDELDGQIITGIGTGVFYDCGISEIILPGGIKIIESNAFNSNELINLIIPNSLEIIYLEAFSNNCINSLTFEATSRLEEIGMDAFHSNRLINIDFPKSLKKIDKHAFYSNLLRTINFEENSQLLSIGSGAFQNNWQLISFILPDPKVNGYQHWIDWEDNKYSNNLIIYNLESFYKIPIEYTLTDNDVEVINGIIVSYSPGNPYANILFIPDRLDGQEIIGIGGGVFRNFGLIGVELPGHLKIIGYGAFADNDLLRIKIPASVEEIQGQAFFRNNINQLVFEEISKLRHIGWGAFSNNKISSLTIPDNMNYIGGYAFAYNRISNGINIPDGIEYIGWSAFSGNNIPELVFGENSKLSYLGTYAFAYNNISNEIFIPTTLTEIPDFAFLNNNISIVIIHDGIVEYGNGAFRNNNPSLRIVLHKPPTIPFVTHFFGWKDNDGIYYNPGEAIPDFSNRYKAVIDQYFVVKFKVVDDNNEPVENASINFYGNLLSTDINGIDSIGPVMRGIQSYEISALGCYDFYGSVDVQDDMTILITLTRYFNVDIKVVDINNNPIGGADLFFNDSVFTFDSNGSIHFNLPNGEYPIVINAAGYQESTSSFTILDADTVIIVTLNPLFVNYFANGGTGVDFSETSYGSNYTVKENLFSLSAYTFSHWSTKPDNSGQSYSEKESITLGYSDIDLFAIWKPVNYRIIYHLDGGINHPDNPSSYTIESEIILLGASKTSLYFATWLDADSNRVQRIEKGYTGDIELWAVFTTEPTYFIDYYNLENASHNNQSFYTKFDLPFVFTDAFKRGYEFLAWYQDSLFTKQIITILVGSKKNYEVYAKWGGLIDYTITYNLDGGLNSSANPYIYTIESSSIRFESPSKTGANFIGWYRDSTHTNEITGIPIGSIGDTILYAKWELSDYSIGYVLNSGTNNPSNPNSYTVESSSIIFHSPTRPGAGFWGWYSDAALTGNITGIPTGTMGDTIVYAKWELDVFSIEYVLNGGGNDSANPDNYTIESDTIFFKAPVKPGYSFIAWHSDEDLTNIISLIPQGSMGDTAIYAKWEIEEYVIYYELEGGENNPANPEKYTIESGTIILGDPERNGFVFAGWYSDSGYLNRIASIPQRGTGNVVIYAKWIEIFKVSFIITTDGFNPAKDVDIIIGNTQKLKSNFYGLADTLMQDGSSLSYSIEINRIVIENGSVIISGSNVIIRIEIVNCYMRWFDVLFCDNGKGLWANFVWYKDNGWVSNEQFYHQPGGIEEGYYKLKVTSVNGVEYIWESKYKSNNFEVNLQKDFYSEMFEVKVYPSPVTRSNHLKILLSETVNLQNTIVLIYSVKGELIHLINNPSYINEININNKFSSGLYHVAVLDVKNKRRIVMDFIVN
jgi:uncharacterized repeat protein (TIGR02543 family)